MPIADLIGATVVLLAGAGIIVHSLRLTYMSEYGPGPGFLPLWLGIALFCSAVALILKILRKRRPLGRFFEARTKEGIKVLVMIIISFLLFPLLGFSVALAFFAAITMRITGRHRWIVCGLTALGVGIGIRFVFGHWLQIPLPTGMTGW